jgi:NAD(P)H-flavin reductase
MTAAHSTPVANPWLTHTVRIAEITPEISGVATYDFEFTDPDQASRYQFLPGQFNMLYLPGVGESAISLSAHPQARGRWSHTIRVAGNVTQTLARLGKGATLGLRGPFGSSWPIADFRDHDIVFVAGGIGLAPLRPAIYHVLECCSKYGQVTLLYGARTPEGMLYTGEYDCWSAGGINIQTTVDRAPLDWKGNVGPVTILLDRLPLDRPDHTALLSCGPDVMMHFTAQSALHRGLTSEQIWLSAERNMQCAIGLCGHCQLGPEFICKDGPVFRYDRIAPFFRVEGL